MPTTQMQKAAAEALSDEDLVELARARDEAAVRAITKRYNRRLFRIARSILRNDAEAEDVVQETYVRAFTGLDHFRGDAAFGTWITRIAMNEALGRLRRRRPTVDWETYGVNRNQAEIIHFPASAASNDPEKAMAQGEVRAVLEHAGRSRLTLTRFLAAPGSPSPTCRPCHATPACSHPRRRVLAAWQLPMF